jgi:hypothetical protein
LRHCIADTASLRSFLRLRGRVEEHNILWLTDGDATTRGILDGIDWLLHDLAAGDRIVFHYSGHGAQIPDGSLRRECICPIDFDWSPKRAITSMQFLKVFAKIPDGVAGTWVVDACHAGGLLNKALTMPQDVALRVPKAYPDQPEQGVMQGLLRNMRGVVRTLPQLTLIAGCRPDQVSEETPAGGVATNALLAALQAEGGLRVSQRTLVSRMVAWCRTQGYAQVPQLAGPDDQVDRPFGDLSAGQCVQEEA